MTWYKVSSCLRPTNDGIMEGRDALYPSNSPTTNLRFRSLALAAIFRRHWAEWAMEYASLSDIMRSGVVVRDTAVTAVEAELWVQGLVE